MTTIHTRSTWRRGCRRTLAALLTAATLADAHDPEAETRLPEMVVQGTRPLTAASSDEIRQRDLEQRPRLRPADILEVVPGLIVVQHAGGGKANQYFLRGFDNDHGTDIALSIDGVPVNMVTHAHGQGYADLHYLIPELVSLVDVRKGPYFLEYGNLAVSGAVNMHLPKRLDQSTVRFTGGQFGVRRGLAMLQLPTEKVDAWVAGEGYAQDGPFDNPEDLVRYNVIARLGTGFGPNHVSLTGSSYQSDWNASGQIPLRLVEAGLLDRFGTLDPTEGGESGRHQLYLNGEFEPAPGWNVEALAYGVVYHLSLFSNFTFFLRDPVNGDEINQKDDRFLGGTKIDATYHKHIRGIPADTRFGFELRADDIRNSLRNVRARELVSVVKSNDSQVFDYSFWAGEDVQLTPWLRTLIGLRLDYLNFNVENRFAGTAPDLVSQGYDSAVVASPKGSAVFTPKENWDVYLNFGRGFHSNDARGVTQEAMPADPVARATGAEIGTRARFLDRIDAAVSYFVLDLSSELVFVGDEGTTEPSGKTRRHGVEFEGRYRILDWLWADLDITQSTARFLDEPSDADEVPLAPRWTISGGLTARHPSGAFGSFRNRSIADRPANEDDSLTAEGHSVFDLEAGWRLPLRRWTGSELTTLALSVDVLNLFDQDYREAQFDTASCTRSERGRVPGCIGSNAPGISDIDFTPGWPRTVLATIEVTF
jgi:outer membrane receptor protein involved in Fe transport